MLDQEVGEDRRVGAKALLVRGEPRGFQPLWNELVAEEPDVLE